MLNFAIELIGHQDQKEPHPRRITHHPGNLEMDTMAARTLGLLKMSVSLLA